MLAQTGCRVSVRMLDLRLTADNTVSMLSAPSLSFSRPRQTDLAGLAYEKTDYDAARMPDTF